MRIVVNEKEDRFYPIIITDGCDLNLGDMPKQEEIDAALIMMRLMDESEVLTLGNFTSFIKVSDDKDIRHNQKEVQWRIVTKRSDDNNGKIDVNSTFSYGDRNTCQKDIDLLFG